MSNYIDNIVKNAVTYDLVSKPLADDIANEFSIQSTYAVGDYVMHDYKLYKCISAITTAGNWNSAKWQECKIGDEINGGVKYTAQTLTSEQKAQARNNIGAVSQEEATPDAVRYSAQSLTDAQKNQARVNVGTVASTSIAEEFSTSKAYAVGDLVMYDSKLYKFKTAHSAGAWNVAQVDAVSVKEEISSLSNDFDKNVLYNTTDTDDIWWSKGYRINSLGRATESTVHTLSSIKTPIYAYSGSTISVVEGYTFDYSLWDDVPTSTIDVSHRLELKRDQTTQITISHDGYLLIAVSNGTTVVDADSAYAVAKSGLIINLIGMETVKSRITSSEILTKELSSNSAFEKSANLINPNGVTNGTIAADGSENDLDTYRKTGFIAVEPNTTYVASGAVTICLYDEAQTFIQRYDIGSADRARYIYRNPKPIKYIRLCTNILPLVWTFNKGSEVITESWGYALSNDVSIANHLDDTLTVEGVAADSLATGVAINAVNDKIESTKNDLKNVENKIYTDNSDDLTQGLQSTLDQHKGYYINLNLPIGTVITYEPTPTSQATSYAVYECSKGDVFEITGKGGNGSRLWGFVDSTDALKEIAKANLNTEDIPAEITAPVDGHLIINVTSLTQPVPTLVRKYKKDVLADLSTIIKEVVDNISEAEESAIVTSKFYHGPLDSLPSDLPIRYRPIVDTSVPAFSENTTYAEIIEAFDALMADTNGYITKQDMGEASGLIDGATPHVYKYTFKPTIATTPITPKNMPLILIDGSMHGFEKTSTYSWYFFLYDLVHNYAQNQTLTYIRGNVEIQIIPVLNPYGFDNKTYTNGNEVNINRNFDTPDWVYVETGSDASGDAPMDQPETKIVEQFISSNPSALVYINTHTNGRYYSTGYHEANSNLMTYIEGDQYLYRLMNVIKKHVQSQTVILPTEYTELTPVFGQTIGRCDQSTKDTDPTTHPGVFEKYIIFRTSTMGFTLELFNGLAIDSNYVLPIYSAHAKAVAAEIAGNMMIEIIREYSR